mmetsp:Transcript_3031/g.6073  ORF Transcript_3031/g.6073 Transcript_3031/m.6073 type:complete len:251 (+) Transcript_3031:362-1114(+)
MPLRSLTTRNRVTPCGSLIKTTIPTTKSRVNCSPKSRPSMSVTCSTFTRKCRRRKMTICVNAIPGRTTPVVIVRRSSPSMPLTRPMVMDTSGIVADPSVRPVNASLSWKPVCTSANRTLDCSASSTTPRRTTPNSTRGNCTKCPSKRAFVMPGTRPVTMITFVAREVTFNVPPITKTTKPPLKKRKTRRSKLGSPSRASWPCWPFALLGASFIAKRRVSPCFSLRRKARRRKGRNRRFSERKTYGGAEII